jgi:LuxR family transcriptional regulator, maltose regulon positive regulatory protein
MTVMISDSSLGVRSEDIGRARSAGEQTSGRLRDMLAGPRPAQRGRQATTDALMSVLDDSVPWAYQVWVAVAFVLGAISRDALDEPDAVGPALERALALPEAERVLFPLLTLAAPGLAERHARHPAAPAAWISDAVDLLAQVSGTAALAAESALICEALTRCEARVLRYLPTNLSTPEIAAELYLSTNTVKTHQRHLYQKLGASSRTEAVERARALCLLAPSSRRPASTSSPKHRGPG